MIPKKWCAGTTADPARLQEVENLVLEENVVAWAMGQMKTEDKAVPFNELMGN